MKGVSKLFISWLDKQVKRCDADIFAMPNPFGVIGNVGILAHAIHNESLNQGRKITEESEWLRHSLNYTTMLHMINKFEKDLDVLKSIFLSKGRTSTRSIAASKNLS